MELTIEQAAEIEEHLPALRRFARGLTGSFDTADDLVQDCLVKAISNYHRFRQGTNLRAWLFTIAHNCHLDAVRSVQRRGPHVDVDDYAGQLQEPAGQMAHVEMEEFKKAFAQLSEGERKILLLVGMEGFSYEEVSEMLDIPVGTLKSRLSRARSRLRVIQNTQPSSVRSRDTSAMVALRSSEGARASAAN